MTEFHELYIQTKPGLVNLKFYEESSALSLGEDQEDIIIWNRDLFTTITVLKELLENDSTVAEESEIVEIAD